MHFKSEEEDFFNENFDFLTDYFFDRGIETFGLTFAALYVTRPIAHANSRVENCSRATIHYVGSTIRALHKFRAISMMRQ